MPTWKELYAAAIVETRRRELLILIGKTERSMTLRRKELTNQPDSDQEFCEIPDASSALKVLLSEVQAWDNYEAH